jgi:LysM repeat protein
MVSVNKSSQPTTTNAQQQQGDYTVKTGDSLWKIAQQHGVSLDELLKANPQFTQGARKPELIFPGEHVNIPSSVARGSAPATEAERRTPQDPAQRTLPESSVDPRSLQAPGDRQNLSAVDKLIDKTARVEGGGRYDAFNPNDNGHGISFGLIQFNQKAGSLPTLLKEMHAKDPAKFNQVFGADSQNLLNENFVRSANLSTPEWRNRFRQAGAHEPFQQVQRDLAKRDYFDPARNVAESLGIKSERGMAMAFDASVQLGVGGMTQRLKAAAAGGGSERQILERFAASADNVTGGHSRRRNLLNDPTLSDGPLGSGSTDTALPRNDGENRTSQARGSVVVQPGDSLSSIAAKNGTTWEELYEANKDQISDPKVIHAGQTLKLPSAPAPSAPVPGLAPGSAESGLSSQVMDRATQIGNEINRTGGYRFDGVNDCWGFVRRVMDPLLKERGLPALPTADAGTPAGQKNWEKITDWSKIPVGTPLSTHQGHAWGAQWHGGIFAGMKNGQPMIYDNSGSGSAQLRPLPRDGYFSYFHKPSAALLG